ncbi:MAG: methyltransferase domain-containing protein [Pseudomonadota bacterium]
MTQQTPPRIIEKHRLSLAKQRARTRLADKPGADFLLRQIGDDLSLRLSVVQRAFEKVLLIAPSHAALVEPVKEKAVGELHYLDEQHMHDDTLDTNGRDFDLIVSVGQLHLIDDVPGMLTQMRMLLRPDGLMLACVPGAATLNSVRTAWIDAEATMTGGVASRFMPLFDVRSSGALLQRAGYALPVIDSEEIDVSYRDVRSIFADLRSMAGGNVLLLGQGHSIKRAVWNEFNQKVDETRDQDGKLRATFELIWMSGWAPSADQPTPLEPGSAQVSLTKILKSS